MAFDAQSDQGSSYITANPSWWDQLSADLGRALNTAVGAWADNNRPNTGAVASAPGSSMTEGQSQMWTMVALGAIGVLAVIVLGKR